MLTVEDLHVLFKTPRGVVNAVQGVSFSVGQEKLGIVGESGSGKSMTGRAIMQLSPTGAQVTAKRLQFKDVDLLAASEQQMLKIRGRRIGLIMQDPKYSLNPIMPVGEQIAEGYRLHLRSSKAEAKEKALSLLEAVKIRNPNRVYGMYPHELSGGMGQRVMIAAVLICEPDLIVADEPTSALDVTVRLDVLAILDELVENRGIGLIFISHDLNLVRGYCDRVLIMYAGRIMESLEAARLGEAEHPYTRGLLAALPRIGERVSRLPVLERDPAWLAGDQVGAK